MSVGRHTSRLLVSASLGTALLLSASAHAAFPGANGKIAFTAGADSQIFVMNSDGSGVVQLTVAPGRSFFPDWSPDGRKIAFTSTRDDPDPAGCSSCNDEIYTMDADGTNVTRLTTTPSAREVAPAWSPDGTKIAFDSRVTDSTSWNIYSMNADGTGVTQLTSELGVEADPAWSPDGSRIAFHHQDIWSMDPDGTDLVNLTNDENSIGGREPDWSPDGTMIAYERDACASYDDDCWSQRSVLTKVRTMQRDGSGQFEFPGYNNSPAWSPDGSRLVMGHAVSCSSDVYVTCVTRLMTVDPDGSDATVLDVGGSDPSWQPLPVKGYPRPRSATPVRVSLVPAYEECTTPDRTHGPPLAYPSCRLSNVGGTSDPESPHLTVGTPDSNAAAAQFTGFVRMKVAVGDPATPADEADVRLEASMVDVRCYSAVFGPPHCTRANTQDGPDYDGELEARVSLRLTDKDNTPHPGGPGPATVTDTTFAFPIQCAQTEDADIGGSCSAATTADALIPGAVKERARAVWQLGALEVHDGGPDGDAETAPNTPFLRQGVYIP